MHSIVSAIIASVALAAQITDVPQLDPVPMDFVMTPSE